MRKTASLLSLVCVAFRLSAGEFSNLDFEQANTNGLIIDLPGSGWGKVEDLLPGWGLAYGDVPRAHTGFLLFPAGEGPNDTVIAAGHYNGYGLPVLGSYALCLQPASFPYHLSQTGEIPTDALSIEFASHGAYWGLTANGTELPLVYTGEYVGPGGPFAPKFELVRGDISAFAGTTTELVFTTGRPIWWADYNVIDNVAFSSRAIPEPSTWCLLGLGGLGLWWARRRRG